VSSVETHHFVTRSPLVEVLLWRAVALFAVAVRRVCPFAAPASLRLPVCSSAVQFVLTHAALVASEEYNARLVPAGLTMGPKYFFPAMVSTASGTLAAATS
jgi:hypothetical protein